MNSKIIEKENIISWIVFLSSILILLISMLSVVFPALLTSSMSPLQESPVNQWEIGGGAWLVLICNLIVFTIWAGYSKNKLPLIIGKTINFIFNFEVSKKITIIVLLIIFVIYTVSVLEEIDSDKYWDDFFGFQKTIDEWELSTIFDSYGRPLNWALLKTSNILFDNYKIIPFVASFVLLLFTFLITYEITKKRFAGLVSVIILLQSHLFLTYDTTPAYTNFWITLYVVSLYFIFKAWPLSSIFYLLSITAKALTTLFLPLSLFFIYRANISHRKKILSCLSYIGILILGVTMMISLNISLVQVLEFNSFEFWQGFTAFSNHLRFDALVLLFIIPLVVGLFIISRNGIIQADSIMVLISGILISAPLLTAFTIMTNQPYRFIPLVVFFAIGVGVLLTKKVPQPDNLKSKI